MNVFWDAFIFQYFINNIVLSLCFFGLLSVLISILLKYLLIFDFNNTPKYIIKIANLFFFILSLIGHILPKLLLSNSSFNLSIFFILIELSKSFKRLMLYSILNLILSVNDSFRAELIRWSIWRNQFSWLHLALQSFLIFKRMWIQ